MAMMPTTMQDASGRIIPSTRQQRSSLRLAEAISVVASDTRAMRATLSQIQRD